MQALHIVLVATTALAFIVAAAPGSRVGSGNEHGRLITLVVSGAAVVGNAASLMSGTPAWYARAMVVITFVVVVWALVSVLNARRGRAEEVLVVRRPQPRVIAQPPVRRVTAPADLGVGVAAATPSQGAPASPAEPAGVTTPSMPTVTAPALGRAHLYAVPDSDIVDAEIVEDEPVNRTATTLRLATQETFDAAEPRGAGARGETYVAAHLGDYLPESKRVARRRSHARIDAEVDLRTRLTRAYGLGVDARGGLASHQA